MTSFLAIKSILMLVYRYLGDLLKNEINACTGTRIILLVQYCYAFTYHTGWVQCFSGNKCVFFASGMQQVMFSNYFMRYTVLKYPYLSPTLLSVSVEPVTVKKWQTNSPQNLQYTGRSKVLKYGLNNTVSLEAIGIIREDTTIQ